MFGDCVSQMVIGGPATTVGSGATVTVTELFSDWFVVQLFEVTDKMVTVLVPTGKTGVENVPVPGFPCVNATVAVWVDVSAPAVE